MSVYGCFDGSLKYSICPVSLICACSLYSLIDIKEFQKYSLETFLSIFYPSICNLHISTLSISTTRGIWTHPPVVFRSVKPTHDQSLDLAAQVCHELLLNLPS